MIEAEHFCMSMRGVKKPGSLTVTSAVRGLFKDNAATRAEAMSLITPSREPALTGRKMRRMAPADRRPGTLRDRCSPGRSVARTAVMGVVNVTPDSFSDGGRYLDPDAAVAHGLALVGRRRRRARRRRRVDPSRRRAGAGEAEELAPGRSRSSRALAAERRRAGEHRHHEGRGRRGGARRRRHRRQRRRPPAGRSRDARRRRRAPAPGYVAMHMQGEPRTMQDDPRYDDVVAEVGDFLRRPARRRARRPGSPTASLVRRSRASGSARPAAHNLDAARALASSSTRVDVPVLVGTSRKTFIGRACSASTTRADERDDGTLATVVWALDQGAAMVRVHDVARRRPRALALLRRARRSAA